ncbi:MAG: hypothetical protein V1793_17620 [Pseudomonadota bacterium]
MKKDNQRDARIEHWEKTRRFWYHVYLFVGVGINFIIYFTKPYGFDPSTNVTLGATVGFGIPIVTMLIGAYIHQKAIGL